MTDDAAVPTRGWLARAALPPATVFGVHVALSRSGAYLAVPIVDVPMHVLGGVAIAGFCAACLRALPDDAVAERLRGRLSFVGIVALTCTAALLWEFGEFLSDRLFGTHAQVDLDDTLFDMALGVGGGLAYATWAGLTGGLRRRRRGLHGADAD